MTDETTNFMNLLLDIKGILTSLYRIEREEFNEFNQISNGTPIINSRKVLEKISLKNPWSHKITKEELTILFYIFKFLSYQVDNYIRGIPVRYDRRGNKEPPITNLRFLCNYYTLITTSIVMIVIYILVILLMKLLSSSN
jgi:hypothetical protein